MHYLDPDSFEAEGPGVNAEEVTQLGHAFIPCLLNRCTALPLCLATTHQSQPGRRALQTLLLDALFAYSEQIVGVCSVLSEQLEPVWLSVRVAAVANVCGRNVSARFSHMSCLYLLLSHAW